ncbi:Exostosin-like [Arabidopsis suecica]|uniref:Exostosin-like n=1 Tax=Arabidopsis suecica TaxID=45249 RepID=A0A8T1YSN8_ARASU|nr:Exostosin-like [Arabidopsis suecica]
MVSKRKSRTSKNIEDSCIHLCSVFFRSFFYTLLAFLFFFLLYRCLSFTTGISHNNFHICIFSRKFNDPYCNTAGSKPGFQISSEENETLTGETAGDRVSGDPTKIFRNEDKKGYDVLKQVDKHKNLDSVRGDKDGFLKNDTFTGETAGDRVSKDPNKILRSEDKKEYDVHEQEDKPKNLDSSVPDQEHKPKNKVDLSSLIDLKAEEEYNKYIKPKSEEEGYALRAVIKYLYLQRSWLAPGDENINKSRSCEGKGVYVYDLPSKFNRDLLVGCNDILPGVDLCSYFKNEGFGEAIKNLGKGWFATHMYSLEPIVHSRVLKHPCRVYNESQAKLFYVPYYGGYDVLRWHYRNVSEDVKDRLGIEVLKWLESKESWRRNAGKDHVFVLGKITWDFRRDKVPWGSRFLELQEMQNPTKLLIERQPWQVNDIAIPHPTYFHPRTDDDITSWQIKIMSKPRPHLVSFAGGARPENPDNIRSTLIEQCVSSSSNQCRFLDCTNGGCKNPKNVLDLFQDSEFCLQPPGDSATRRSVFDSLISGCIPVIFTPYTAYYQYAWHLPEDHRRYSVYISEQDVKEKRVNVVEILKAKTLREKKDMRSYIIHQLLPGLVYGDSNAKFEKFRDAFDITFDSLLEKINKSE